MRQRKEVSEAVASAKIQQAVPFRDALREEQVLTGVRQRALDLGLDPRQMEHLYRLVMEISISHQQAYLEQLGDVPLRVAYQGVEGSYSHLTCQRRYAGRAGGVLLTGFETFRRAADSVREGINDVALLPIENSTAGSINETYDLLSEGGLVINAEEILRVSHCLLGLPGAKLDAVRRVFSHPQGLRQCERYLQRLGVAVEEVFDTAGAAQQVRDRGDATIAAIASENAASVWGLEILARDVQDHSANFTRFVEVAVEAAPCPPDRPCKTSLRLVTGNEPGDLGEVLRHFSSRRINLNKLESRPVPQRPFEYCFYLDIEGHAQSRPVVEALRAIEKHTEELAILGTYPRARGQQ
ncbi:MAG: prephenate dehydratase [Acidobacteria bacterium]|nr:MAG: prephenate dehydratase [Acidobacteriota bacterium]REK09799.1 MAG: prephenate dehydratase [Acidobacteriota bacterium]